MSRDLRTGWEERCRKEPARAGIRQGRRERPEWTGNRTEKAGDPRPRCPDRRGITSTRTFCQKIQPWGRVGSGGSFLNSGVFRSAVRELCLFRPSRRRRISDDLPEIRTGFDLWSVYKAFPPALWRLIKKAGRTAVPTRVRGSQHPGGRHLRTGYRVFIPLQRPVRAERALGHTYRDVQVRHHGCRGGPEYRGRHKGAHTRGGSTAGQGP